MLVRLGVFVLWLIQFLPFRVIVAIGNGLGTFLYPLAAERRRVGMINLKLCFPDMSDEARVKLLRDHYKMFCRGLIERSILWWSRHCPGRRLCDTSPGLRSRGTSKRERRRGPLGLQHRQTRPFV